MRSRGNDPYGPKDANDALLCGADIPSIIAAATAVPHERVVSFAELRRLIHQEVTNPQLVLGVPSKLLPKFNSLIKGHRAGELSIYTGRTGSLAIHTGRTGTRWPPQPCPKCTCLHVANSCVSAWIFADKGRWSWWSSRWVTRQWGLGQVQVRRRCCRSSRSTTACKAHPHFGVASRSRTTGTAPFFCAAEAVFFLCCRGL